MKVALVCSPGGHFFELYALSEFWRHLEHFWVTFPAPDTRCLLKGEKVYDAYYPTNRHPWNAVKNLFLALKILRAERPQLLVTTGAGVSAPFIYAAKFLRIETVYIECITRVDSLSLTAHLIRPVVNHFLVQWPELADSAKARYEGQCL